MRDDKVNIVGAGKTTPRGWSTGCVLRSLNGLNTVSSEHTVEVAYVTYFIVLLFLTFTELIKAISNFLLKPILLVIHRSFVTDDIAVVQGDDQLTFLLFLFSVFAD